MASPRWAPGTALAALWLLPSIASGQASAPALLTFDLNTSPRTFASGLPIAAGAAVGARALFKVCDAADGCEVWSYDGETRSFGILLDLQAGAPGSSPAGFLAAGDSVFFVATPSAWVGSNFWFSDGTPEGTTFAGRPLGPTWTTFGVGSRALGSPAPGVVVADAALPGLEALVRAEAGGALEILRVIGGADRMPGVPPDGYPVLDSRVFFSFCAIETGCEPWVSDGTVAGTRQVADLAAGAPGSEPTGFEAFQDRIYFAARLASGVSTLWRIHPRSLEVETLDELADLPPGAAIGGLEASPSRLLFLVYPPGAATEVWAFDGTIARRVFPLADSPAPAATEAGGLRATGAGVFFWVSGPTGTFPWFSSDSGAPALQLSPVFVGETWRPVFFRAGNRVGFSGYTEATGSEPWISDGTAEGTLPLGDLRPGPEGSGPEAWTPLGDGLLFTTTREDWRRALWRLSGGELTLEAEIGPRNESSVPHALAIRGERVLVSARTSEQHRALVAAALDGSASFAELLEKRPGDSELSPLVLGHLQGRHLIWRGGSPQLPAEVWTTDGTPEQTRIGGAYETSSMPPMGRGARAQDGIVFRACQEATGCEPWRADADGRPAPVADLQPGSDSGWVGSATIAGTDEGLLFCGWSPETGAELWRTDGTEPGSRLRDDVRPGTASSGPTTFAALPSALLFAGYANGAPMDRALYLIAASGGPAQWITSQAAHYGWELLPPKTASNGLLAGPFIEPAYGVYALWVSDGTAEGTRSLVKPTGTSDYLLPTELATHDGLWYFVRTDPARGAELWVSDPATSEARLVADLAPKAASSDPRELTAGGSGVYFVAYTVETGRELWRTTGRGAGVELVADLVPGPGGTDPSGLIYDGDHLCWMWTSPDIGQELACLRDPASTIFDDDFEIGDLLDWTATGPPVDGPEPDSAARQPAVTRLQPSGTTSRRRGTGISINRRPRTPR